MKKLHLITQRRTCDATSCCYLKKKFCYDVETGKAIAFESSVNGVSYSTSDAACQSGGGTNGSCIELFDVIWESVSICYPACGRADGQKKAISYDNLEAEFDVYKLRAKNVTAYVYPNPTIDELNITLSRMETGNFTLMSLDGRVVLESSINQSDKTKINVEQLPSGTYILQYRSKDLSVFMTEKIVIQ